MSTGTLTHQRILDCLVSLPAGGGVASAQLDGAVAALVETSLGPTRP
jgi:hypothetical protein